MVAEVSHKVNHFNKVVVFFKFIVVPGLVFKVRELYSFGLAVVVRASDKYFSIISLKFENKSFSSFFMVEDELADNSLVFDDSLTVTDTQCS